MEIKGLVDVFKEFIRPKTIREQLDVNKVVVKLQKNTKVEKETLKKEYSRVI